MLNLKFVYLISFCLLSAISVFPQDFLFTGWFLRGGSSVGGADYFCIVREKLQPYHISAIKINGISKEYHIEGKDTVFYIEYSQQGLMTKVGRSSLESDFDWSEDYKYDEKNRLISISDFLTIIRDESGKISGGSEDGNTFTYYYKNGSLFEVKGLLNDKKDFLRYLSSQTGSHYNDELIFRKKGYGFLMKEGTDGQFSILDVTTDLHGRTIHYFFWEAGTYSNFDKYGRLKNIRSSGEGVEDKTTITYKGNLMTKIQSSTYYFGQAGPQNSNTRIIKYEYAHKVKK